MKAEAMTASDTPETDAEYARIDGGQCLSGCCSLAHDPDCPVCFDFELMTRFARKLEADRDRLAALLERVVPHIHCTEDCYTRGMDCTCDRDKLQGRDPSRARGEGLK